MPRFLLVLLVAAIVGALVAGVRRDATHAAPRIPATYPPTRHVVDGPRLVFCVRGACGGPETWAQRSLRHARALADLRARLAELRQRVRHLAVHTDAAPPVATDDWRARQIAAAEKIGAAADAAGTDPWPNCPDPYDHTGASWDDTVQCENSGNWLDSPGYFRCGLQFEPRWETVYGRLCP